jgi:hypothetical protein
MAIERVQIGNNEQWGRLVKTWATGDNYLNDGRSYPHPATLAEFEVQCLAAGVALATPLPSHIKSIMIIQASKEVLLIKLPPKEMVKDSEEVLKTESYTLAPFYKAVFGGNDPVIQDKLKFHAERIGDYTLSNCL